MKKMFLLLWICGIAYVAVGCQISLETVKRTICKVTDASVETIKSLKEEQIRKVIQNEFTEDHSDEHTDASREESIEDSSGENITLEGMTEEDQAAVEVLTSYCIEDSKMPKVKNQGNTNTCWAFAALSAAESSMAEKESGAFSADHLIFHNTYGDSFENGGSYIVPMSYMLAWKGPVWEGTDPFDGESPDGAEPCVHVQEIRQSEAKDYDAIKRMVYLYGGVESALYVDFDQYVTDSSYYNRKYNSYCYNGKEKSNHDVVIIGWDDEYPAKNFLGNVTTDGAFLCLSSWGAEFGNAGTFYVSYEDVNIGEYGIAYSRIDPVDNYDRIYQSDLCGFTAQIGYHQETAWFANVYTTAENIAVQAAGFYSTAKNTKYEIYMIPQFANEHSFAMMQHVCSGYLEDAGFYTIDFPEDFDIKSGKDFAVIVKITTENAEYPVAVECAVEGLSENADLSDGRGYLSLQGKRWEHVEETQNYNICLKAYGDLR